MCRTAFKRSGWGSTAGLPFGPPMTAPAGTVLAFCPAKPPQLRLQCLINNFVKSYAGTSASPPAALPPGPSGGTAAEAAARLLSLTVKSVRQQAPAINAQDVVSRQLHARVVLK